MQKFVLASNNPHKAEEIKAALNGKFEILTLSDAGISINVVEDGETFEENAIKKATAVAKLTDWPVISDDSGLMVDYLNGAPGVHTAYFAGENATDDMNIDKLLREIDGVPADKRGAKFVCIIAVIQNGETLTFRGECCGKILEQRDGVGGFGYDPIFYYPPYDQTFATLPQNIKNEVSHRGNALRLMAEKIK
ncbi:MAG: XTP/dITP diphosphatase [Oscillospiraceae bacterium]|nr:XTP/dITP diphosphatase [Oscillospiraceae bacterium]